jgi:hypothetical protein
MGRTCSTHGKDDNAYRTSVGKSEVKRPLERPRCRWKYIRMDLREIEWEGVWNGFIWLWIGTSGGLL